MANLGTNLGVIIDISNLISSDVSLIEWLIILYKIQVNELYYLTNQLINATLFEIKNLECVALLLIDNWHL